VRLEVRV